VTKQFLNGRIFGEVDKVIKLEAQREWFVGNIAGVVHARVGQKLV
jgi:hypothetical protein